MTQQNKSTTQETREPGACNWCGVVPTVVKGAGYNYSVECQTETCIVQPSTVGIRGRQNAINA